MPTTDFFDSLQAEDRTPIKQRIRDFFRWHIGKDKAVNLDDIVTKVAGSTSSSNKRKVRMGIKEAVDEGALICSNSSDGYWLAGSWHEVDEAAGELLSRANELRERATSLKENAAREFGGQKGMFE
jgi:hypothetical protein